MSVFNETLSWENTRWEERIPGMSSRLSHKKATDNDDATALDCAINPNSYDDIKSSACYYSKKKPKRMPCVYRNGIVFRVFLPVDSKG